jgi:hypothetical protein
MAQAIVQTGILLVLLLAPAVARAELRRVDMKVFGMD